MIIKRDISYEPLFHHKKTSLLFLQELTRYAHFFPTADINTEGLFLSISDQVQCLHTNA